jgi:hypothetical protein
MCTTLALCVDAGSGPTWSVTPPAPGCGQNPPACPAAFGTGEGGSCPVTTRGQTCFYDQGGCGCISCRSDGGSSVNEWHCRAWNASDVGAACPARRPLLGMACGSVPDGTVCDYDQCCLGPSLGQSMQCSSGAWTPAFSGGCACGIPLCP